MSIKPSLSCYVPRLLELANKSYCKITTSDFTLIYSYLIWQRVSMNYEGLVQSVVSRSHLPQGSFSGEFHAHARQCTRDEHHTYTGFFFQNPLSKWYLQLVCACVHVILSTYHQTTRTFHACLLSIYVSISHDLLLSVALGWALLAVN